MKDVMDICRLCTSEAAAIGGCIVLALGGARRRAARITAHWDGAHTERIQLEPSVRWWYRRWRLEAVARPVAQWTVDQRRTRRPTRTRRRRYAVQERCFQQIWRHWVSHRQSRLPPSWIVRRRLFEWHCQFKLNGAIIFKFFHISVTVPFYFFELIFFLLHFKNQSTTFYTKSHQILSLWNWFSVGLSWIERFY